MDKISINLLPPEFRQEELKQKKFYKIQVMGVMIIFLMAFLTSMSIALRILQSHNISQVQLSVNAQEQKVSDLKGTQASLLLLKNRLGVIGQYLGTPSKQTFAYALIDQLVGTAISINALSIDRTGDVSIVGLIPDSVALETLIESLTTKEKNENKISQISIDSLSRGKDGVYRISLKIKPR